MYLLTVYNSFLTYFLYVYRKFDEYVTLNRWEYDPDRLIPITSLNPQRSRKYDKVVSKDKLLNSNNFDAYAFGLALGSRVADVNGQLKSLRNLMQQKKEKADCDKSAPSPQKPPAPKPKSGAKKKPVPKKDGPSKTAAPTWTPKLRQALTKAVKKYEGQANNGGIAWARVVEDLNISKHFCLKEWKNILAEGENSSSDSESEGELITGKGASVPGPTASVPSKFEQEMMTLLKKQNEQLQQVTASNNRLLEDTKNLKRNYEDTERKMKSLQSRLAAEDKNNLTKSSSDDKDYSEPPRSRKSRKIKRPRLKSKRKTNRRNEFQFEDLIDIQTSTTQADLICSLTKERDLLRLYKKTTQK